MSDSVAGKIRIDLLANVAQFKAGMREAGREGLGSFQEEVKRFNRAPASQKAMAEAIQGEKDAWKSAMREVRGYREAALGVDRGTTLRFNSLERMNATVDPVLRRQTRLKSYLPWGMTVRTELTREAAETAAAIGDGGAKIARAYYAANADIMRAARMSGIGMGPLGGALSLANKHPLLAVGAAGTALVVKAVRDRDALVRQVAEESRSSGQSVRNVSARLGEQVTDEDIARVKAYDHAVDDVQRALGNVGRGVARVFGGESGLGTHLMRGWTAAVNWDWEGLREKWAEEDYLVEHATDIAAREKKAKRLQEMRRREKEQRAAVRASGMDALGRLNTELRITRQGQDAVAREDFIRSLKDKTGGLDWRGKVGDFDRMTRELRAADAAREQAEKQRDEARQLADRQRDARRLAMSPTQSYQERLREIDSLKLPEAVSLRLRQQAGRDALSSLGVEAPELDYRDQARNLLEAFRGGGFGRDKYDQAMRKLRERTVAAMTADQGGGVSPIAALALGSQGAHSLLAQAQLQGPQVQLAREANAKLDTIIQELRIANNDDGTVFEIGP